MGKRRKAKGVEPGRKPGPPLRAIAYLRVSTDVQAERGMGLAVQREKVKAWAEKKEFELLEIVQEAASGGVQNGEEFSWEHRPVLLELMERAQRGEYDVLLVARLDRLSRDYATLIILERRLERCGVEVASTEEENGDSPLAEYLRGNLALAAQLERALIRDRLTSGKLAKKKLGRHIHGRVPYGYGSEGGILEPVPELIAVVRRIFEDARDGHTPGRIARGLNREGIPSAQGGEWSPQVIRQILRNPAYAGERHEVKQAHPAIVSKRLFNAANAALNARSGRPAADGDGE
jgi:site-specific DNA recombinase